MSLDPSEVTRTTPPQGPLWDVARNRDITTGVGKLTEHDLSVTTDRRGVWLRWEMLAGLPVDHGTVADEAAMLALHTFDADARVTVEPRCVVAGDTCTRTDLGSGYLCLCISNHGQLAADWRILPTKATTDALEVELATKVGSATLDVLLDERQPIASALTELSSLDTAELARLSTLVVADPSTPGLGLLRISTPASEKLPRLNADGSITLIDVPSGGGGGGSGDAVVDCWLQRIACAGGTSASTTVGALVSLFGELRAANIVGHLRWMELFLGDSFSAAKVPQMRPDCYTTFTGFTSGDWSLAGGLVGTGATKYISLNFAAAELGTSGKGGLGAWLLTTPADGNHPYVIGATSVGGAQRFALQLSLSNSGFYWGANTNGAMTGAAATPGHYYGQRSSVASRTLYRDGASVATNTTSDATALLDTAMCAMGAGGDSRYFASSVGAIYATDGELTAEQIATMHSALVASMAAIGRV